MLHGGWRSGESELRELIVVHARGPVQAVGPALLPNGRKRGVMKPMFLLAVWAVAAQVFEAPATYDSFDHAVGDARQAR